MSLAENGTFYSPRPAPQRKASIESANSIAAFERLDSASVHRLPGKPRVIVADSTQLEWEKEITNRLNELCALDRGWDGYKGIPVRFDVAKFAFNLLNNICTPLTPKPDIVPLPSGGLQIEWHEEKIEIELAVRGPNNVEAWIIDEEHPEGDEMHFTNVFYKLLPAIQKLG